MNVPRQRVTKNSLSVVKTPPGLKSADRQNSLIARSRTGMFSWGNCMRDRNAPVAWNGTGFFSPRGSPKRNRNSLSPEKLSSRSGRRPESVFGRRIWWNRDSPVLAPLGDSNIQREDGGTGESRFHPNTSSKNNLRSPSWATGESVGWSLQHCTKAPGHNGNLFAHSARPLQSALSNPAG